MTRLFSLFLLFSVVLLVACGGEGYHYPSVKLEYLTACSGSDGSLQYVVTDAGERLPVAVDGTGLSYEADDRTRIVTNYDRTVAEDGGESARLYAGIRAVSPVPRPAGEFEGGIHIDPAQVLSIWPGLDYLNIILEVKAQEGHHVFHFIEEQVTEDSSTGRVDVHLLLYHDDGGDRQAYTQRAYLSVPLQGYLSRPGMKSLVLHFSLHSYDGGVKTYDVETFPAPSDGDVIR